jgi:hypothetical protein
MAINGDHYPLYLFLYRRGHLSAFLDFAVDRATPLSSARRADHDGDMPAERRTL